MANETHFETLRPLYIAIAVFVTIAAISFGWAAIEAQNASAASQRQTATAVAP
jgi:hypothetical protein